MKKIFISAATVIISLSFLSGCSTSERKDTGMVVGGVAGGLAGNALTGGSTAGTIAGAVGGGYIGRKLTN